MRIIYDSCTYLLFMLKIRIVLVYGCVEFLLLLLIGISYLNRIYKLSRHDGFTTLSTYLGTYVDMIYGYELCYDLSGKRVNDVVLYNDGILVHACYFRILMYTSCVRN